MKKRAIQKSAWYCNFHKLIKVSLIILLILFIAAQLSVDSYLLHQDRVNGTLNIKQLIIEATRNLRKEAVVDGPSGKVYLPDAHLVLPANSQAPQIAYTYEYTPDLDEHDLLVSAKNTIGQGIARINSATTLQATFDAVPKLQACSRQIYITFKPDSTLVSPEYHLVNSMKLADRRELYIYLNSNCTENSAELIEYIKQLQSY